MSDANELTRLIKKAACEAVDAGNPTSLVYGTVISTSPLRIITEQQLPLGQQQLVLCRSVTDYTVNVTTAWTTGSASGGSGESSFSAHAHSISGGVMTVHNALQAGEKVVMIRQQGGQRFVVLDRVR